MARDRETHTTYPVVPHSSPYLEGLLANLSDSPLCDGNEERSGVPEMLGPRSTGFPLPGTVKLHTSIT